MCLICVGLDNNTLTPWEAARNRTEMLDEFDEKHLILLEQKINKSLIQFLDNLPEENSSEN